MKFNIGDKVRVVNGIKCSLQPFDTIGEVCEIRSIGSNDYYDVRANDVTKTYTAQDLEYVR